MVQTKKHKYSDDITKLLMWWNDQINLLIMPPAGTADQDAPCDLYKQERNRALEETARHKKYARNARERSKPLNNARTKLKKILAGCPQELQTTDLAEIEKIQKSARKEKTSIAESIQNLDQHADLLGKKRFVFFGATLGARIHRDLEKGKHKKAHKKLDKMHITRFARQKTKTARSQAISALKKQVGQHNKQANLDTQAKKLHKKVEDETVKAIDKLLKQDYANNSKHSVLSRDNTTATKTAQNHQGLQILQKLAARDQKPDKNEIRTVLQTYNTGSVEKLQQDIDALREEHQNQRTEAQAEYRNYDAKYNAVRTLTRQMQRIQRCALLNLPSGDGRNHAMNKLENAVTAQDGEQLRKELASNFDTDTLKTALDNMNKKGPNTEKIEAYIEKLRNPNIAGEDLPGQPIGCRQNVKAWLATHGGKGLSQTLGHKAKGPKALSSEFVQKARGIAANITPQQAVQPMKNISRDLGGRIKRIFDRRVPGSAHKPDNNRQFA